MLAAFFEFPVLSDTVGSFLLLLFQLLKRPLVLPRRPELPLIVFGSRGLSAPTAAAGESVVVSSA